MGRRRLIAVAVVLASGGAALAFVLPGTPGAESNPAIPVNANGRVVFSLRNTTGTPSTVTSFFGSGSDCMQITSPVPLDGIQMPWTIAPNQQMQFTAETAGFSTTGDKSCFWTVFTNPSGSSPSVGTTFHVVPTADVDVQPIAIDFGTRPPLDSEQQTLVITGWQTGAADVVVEITSNPMSQYELISCGSASMCTISLPGSGGFGRAVVQCNATGSGSDMGQITVRSTDGLTTYATVGLSCEVSSGSGIFVNPMMLMQQAPIGGTDVDPVDVSGPGSITGASISSNLGTLTLQACGQPTCSFAAILPTTIYVVCAPMASADTGTLNITGTAGSASVALQCAPSIGSPLLYVSRSSVPFDDTNVFGMDSDTFTIENQGSGSLTNVTLSLGAGGGDFAFDVCNQNNPCTVTAGTPQVITVTFAPETHAYKEAQLTVTADGSGGGTGSGSGQTETVLLSGTAFGGVMVVAEPMASENYHLDLGTLPLNQVGSADIVVRNDGNATITTMITGDSAPYTLLTNSAIISGGGSGATFEVRCTSATPSLSNEQTWTVSSSAYTGSPQNITVSCAIADTNVIVDPLAFDFGEVRTGTPAQATPLTVTNPGPGSAAITSMKLRAPRTGLSLSPADTMTTLAIGATASATLKLETDEDSDLSGEFVDVEVGSATLSLPVRGKVVTAHSRIAPEKLDLGTACIGSTVKGTVRLINDGTATLGVVAPEMDTDAGFLATTTGTMFPAALVPGMDIAAEIAPTSTATGKLTGMLTWHDDVPSTYEVPVSLEYVASGTALSPRGLDYGSVAVDALDTSQSVTLENCDTTPAKVLVKSIRGIKGPIGAWVIEPRVGFTKVLQSHERQALLVTFAPPARGHYEAELVVETNGGQEKILLVGDATGREFDNTSFYSCACSVPGAPWGGWPIALAVVVISGRRRRGSSSSR